MDFYKRAEERLSNVRLYKARVIPVQAIQLDTIALSYTKWGGQQKSKKGDWLLSKNGDQYTCEKAVFKQTYKPLKGKPGWYFKDASVKAVVAQEDGKVETLEGLSSYKKGDYIITNPGGDRYCIKKSDFEKLYEV